MLRIPAVCYCSHNTSPKQVRAFRTVFFLLLCSFPLTFQFNRSVVTGFALGDILDMVMVMVMAVVTGGVFPAPPRCLSAFLSRIGPLFIRFLRSSRFNRILLTQALALSARKFLARKVPTSTTHSVILKSTTLDFGRDEIPLLLHQGRRHTQC